MPLIHMAKLADLKADGGWSGNETDAKLLRYLAAASSMAERAAGVEPGGLRRAVDRVEFPSTDASRSSLLRLDARCIESVSQVVQLYTSGTDADFDTAVTNGDTLTENVDYAVESDTLASLVRINESWYRKRPRCLRITYTAGLADPARIRVVLTEATWTEATRTLTQAGAFADYTHAAGDKISIEGGAGATKGTYLIASRTDNNAVVLDESLSADGVDLAAADITSAYADMAETPVDLQQAVIQQAVMLRNTADTSGLESIDFGDAGGSVSLRAMKPHPALIQAAHRYRRLI